MAKSKPAAATTEQREFLERRVWSFSRSPDEQNQNELYIHPNTAFDAFKAGKITDLSFHMSGLAEPALGTDIELFAAHLHLYLREFDVDSVGDPAIARGAIRDAASDTQLAMQDLLDAVVENYREN
jgi:hypothetical protein